MKRFWIVMMALAGLLLAAGCDKKEDEPNDPGGGNGPASGTARLSGEVRDAAGEPLPNVALHVVYEFEAPAATAPLTPSTTFFYYDGDALTTTCGGSTPLQDGVLVRIFWDRDGDGIDADDPQPPLCDDPPDCINGPAGTVNLTEFTMNGVAVELGAGRFYMERGLATIGDVLTPNRYYVRIYCTDGNPLWESNVVDAPAGFSEHRLEFECRQCEGEPVVPQWSLLPAYPNPAQDTITVQYSLLESSPVLLTLQWPRREHTDTLLYLPAQGAGAHTLTVALNSLRHDLYNGLYAVRMAATGYQADHPLLYNVTDYERLRAAEPAALSEGTGGYTFDTAAGVGIRRIAADGTPGDLVQLTRLTLVAIKPGYQIADTTLANVGSGETHTLNLRLIPE